MNTRKSSETNRFEHRCLEYATNHRDIIRNGMCNVLCSIAHFLNAKTLTCFPSFDTIAGHAAVNRSTVIRNIHKLVNAGILSITQVPLRSGGVKNVYRIAFISSDFCVKPRWQKATLSRINKPSTKINPNTNNNTTSMSNTQTNGEKLDTDAVLPWLKFMGKVKRSEHVDLGCHIPAYAPASNGIPEDIMQDGGDVPETRQTAIINDPIGEAVRICGEQENPIFRKTMSSRLNRLGRKVFAAEVIRMTSCLMVKNSIRHIGKVLRDRMDKTFACLVATNGWKTEWNDNLLWDVAHGLKPIPSFAIA